MQSFIDVIKAYNKKTGEESILHPETVGDAVKLANGKTVEEIINQLMYGGTFEMITEAEYNALSDEERNDGTIRIITDALDEYVETKKLASGETTVTFTHDFITDDKSVDIYVSKFGISPDDAVFEEPHSIKLTFSPLDSDIDVKVVVK